MDYISIDSSADVIEHFGIKGMKWGRRKLFYEKRSYKKNPTRDRGTWDLKDYGAARRKTGLSRFNFGFNPKYSKQAFSELHKMRDLKDSIRDVDYSLQNIKREGVNIHKYGKHLSGKDLKEFTKRMKFHNSKENEHPEHLDYEGYMKWVDNYHHLDRLGTKGAQRRRKQLIKQYRKEVGYD